MFFVYFSFDKSVFTVGRYNRAFGGSRSVPPALSDPTPFEAIEPFAVAKMRQKSAIQPSLRTADPRVQEGQFINNESEMGKINKFVNSVVAYFAQF